MRNALDMLSDAVREVDNRQEIDMLSAEKFEESIDIVANMTCLPARVRTQFAFLATIDLAGVKEAFSQSLIDNGQPSKSDAIVMFNNLVASEVSKFANWSDVDSKLYMRQPDGRWLLVSREKPRVNDVVIAVNALLPSVFPIDSRATEKAASFLISSISSTLINPDNIQFADSVLTSQGDLIDCDSAANALRPQFISSLDARQLTDHVDSVSAVDDLIDHVSGHDDATRERLLDLCAMAFVLNPAVKTKLSKAVMLYGPTAENGKSTFIKLLASSLGNDELVTTVPINEFKGFRMADLPGKLLVVDPDGSGQHIDAEAANNLKKIVTCDRLQLDRKHKDAVQCVLRSQLLMASNGLPKSEDKSHGWERRIEWFPIEEKLVRDDAWFDQLRSADAKRYMLSILLKRAIHIMKTREIAPASKRVAALNEEYSNTNNNIKRWLSERDIAKDIHLHSLVEVRQDYEQWCEENAEPVLGRNTFAQSLESVSTLKRRHIRVSAKLAAEHPDVVEAAKIIAKGKPTCRMWVDTAEM